MVKLQLPGSLYLSGLSILVKKLLDYLLGIGYDKT